MSDQEKDTQKKDTQLVEPKPPELRWIYEGFSRKPKDTDKKNND
ncbi:hypothetical protein [Domibacillus antri]|nr:hypothetical protein [Domibacillus antri]